MLCLETARLKQTEQRYIRSQKSECRRSLSWMFHLQCADENVFLSVSCSLRLFMFLLCSASLPSHLSNGSNLRIKAMEHYMSDINLLPEKKERHLWNPIESVIFLLRLKSLIGTLCHLSPACKCALTFRTFKVNLYPRKRSPRPVSE